MTRRMMRLGLSIRGYGYHPGAWRDPDVPADGPLHIEHYVRNTQTAERGKMDMIFFADGAGIRHGDFPAGAMARIGSDVGGDGADDIAAGAGHGDAAGRPRDDRVDDL